MTRHKHDWSPWGEWYFASGNVDARERDCQDPDCGQTDTGTRQHIHEYKSYPDPYAPVGSGLTIAVCTLCHQPRGK